MKACQIYNVTSVFKKKIATTDLHFNLAPLPILPHVMKLPLIIDWAACTVKLEEMCMVLPVFPVSLNINENVWVPRIQIMPRKLSQHLPALEKDKTKLRLGKIGFAYYKGMELWILIRCLLGTFMPKMGFCFLHLNLCHLSAPCQSS